VPGRAREAEEHVRRASVPGLAYAYPNLGTALAAQHRYDEATWRCERTRSPGIPPVHGGSAYCVWPRTGR